MSSGMLLNGRTSKHCLNYSGCACHNTKNARRKARKSVKAKGKAADRREFREQRA
jgi:hypothetical protein